MGSVDIYRITDQLEPGGKVGIFDGDYASMTEAQAEAWAAAMLARSEQGTFFGASNYDCFVAVKP